MAPTLRRIVAAFGVAIGFVKPADGQIRVNPTGMSVSSMSATSVFLTYGGLRDQRPADAFWCGELVSAAPARGMKCDPATLFGRLPSRYDLSRGNTSSLTDIMSVPPSVARLAYQAAAAGAISSFFYVRRFESLVGGPDEYVVVTCRLTSGGPNVPFSLTDVRVAFDGQRDVLFVGAGDTPPLLSARIAYTGTGRLVGRWEVVLPGEEPPTDVDLLPEGSLPPDARGSQRRYSQLERFNIFLPPDGRVTLPGPDPRRLPSQAEGTYRVLLRVEASDDREADSNLGAVGAGTGVVHSGAMAGFPMPVLLYVVAGDGARTKPSDVGPIRLQAPRDSDTVRLDSVFTVAWITHEAAAFHKVEFETDQGAHLFGALLPGTARAYRVPPIIRPAAETRWVRWRVTALRADGTALRQTPWRSLRLGDTVPPSSSANGSRRTRP